MNEIDNLQEWYLRYCNDDWEHQYGVSIDTLDNPGWSLKIDLKGTDLEKEKMDPIEIHRSEEDWVVARRSEYVFEAFCGARNLAEMIRTFLDWEQNTRAP
jgi:hypothetical protein